MANKNLATLDDLLIQLKVTNRLLSAQLRDRMMQNELIGLLISTGASHREIAEVLDTSVATVQVTVHRMKKKAQKKKNNETERK